MWNNVLPGIPAHIKALDSKGCRPKGFRKPSTRRTRVESAMDGFMRVCESLLADRPCLLGTFRPGIADVLPDRPCLPGSFKAGMADVLRCSGLILTSLLSLLFNTPIFSGEIPAPAAPKDIVFWHSMAGSLGEEVLRLTQQFNASQTEYRVKPIYKGDYMESLTSFAAAFRAKHPPNIVQVFEVGTSVMRSPSGVIKPVQQLMDEQGIEIPKDRFFPAVLQRYSDNGRLMAMPFNVSIPVMFYNADALAPFGVSEASFPKTWDELESLAKRLHQAGFSCTYTTAYPAWILIESYRALHGIYSSDHPLTSDIEAHINRMRRWQSMHYFVYGGRGDDATMLFTSGKCPIFSQSSGGYVGLSQLVPFQLGVAAMPIDTEKTAVRQNNVVGGAALWVVSGQSRDIERGVALYLAFLSQTNIQLEWYQHTGYLPLDTLSVQSLSKEKRNTILEIATQDLTHDQALGVHLNSGAGNQIRVIEDQMLEAIFSGMMQSNEAMKRAKSRTQHVLKRFRNNTYEAFRGPQT